jgi:hypothetical protein
MELAEHEAGGLEGNVLDYVLEEIGINRPIGNREVLGNVEIDYRWMANLDVGAEPARAVVRAGSQNDPGRPGVRHVVLDFGGRAGALRGSNR